MEAKQLLDLVSRYEENREFITNEETTKMALIVPFIRHLGYDPNSPREVRLEYTAEFTQGDGKRLPDRMDYAIFDQTGKKPLMVVEAKPLGFDLESRSQQLARYLAQMSDLHFGILTDGCHYLFFGDLESPNQMDQDPFFQFALDDPASDWARIGDFLAKFSREAFNAETLVTDAENSRYRQAITDKIAGALRDPKSDEGFLRWVTEDVYKGKRTTGVMERLGQLVKEAIEPALMSVLEADFLDNLKERFVRAREIPRDDKSSDVESASSEEPCEEPTSDDDAVKPRAGVETTDEELEFHSIVREICAAAGQDPDKVIHRDTTGYFNVSYGKPTKWFLRFFANAKRKSVTTLVPLDDVNTMLEGFETDAPHPNFGASRIYVENPAQLWAFKSVVVRSLELLLSDKT